MCLPVGFLRAPVQNDWHTAEGEACRPADRTAESYEETRQLHTCRDHPARQQHPHVRGSRTHVRAPAQSALFKIYHVIEPFVVDYYRFKKIFQVHFTVKGWDFKSAFGEAENSRWQDQGAWGEFEHMKHAQTLKACHSFKNTLLLRNTD